MPRVAAYPWASLERLSRAAVRGSTRARRAVMRALDPSELARAVSEVCSTEAFLVVRDCRVAEAPAHGGVVAFRLGDGTRIVLSPEPELAAFTVGRVLGRSVGLAAPGAPLDAALVGAFAAVVLEVARRARALEPPLLEGFETPMRGAAVRLDVTLVLDARSFALTAWVAPGATPPETVDLKSLGTLPVSLPLVVALSSADPAELATLVPGAAWLPGAGLMIDARGAGRGVLAAPSSEHGLGVDLAADGSIVVGANGVPLQADQEMTKNEAPEAVAENVLEAPIVVRVELGSVSMTAREWGALRPGDVIEVGKRVAEPVVLRVAGREVARGELVEVEGEIGVRVRELMGGG
jgi:flagellar motor switch/type III secretory pathway protein FliN